MTVFLTIAGLAPEFGGPSRSVPALAEALGRNGVTVSVITCESLPGHSSPLIPNARLASTTILPVRSRRGKWRSRKNDFFRELCNNAGSANTVIHDNGLWLPTNHAVARAAGVLKYPLIISPRGMLSDWATAHRGWKKRIAWMLFQRRDLFSAAALHATSALESEDFRRVGFRGPIAVVPNGIDLPPLVAQTSTNDTQLRTRTAFFLSRLHPKKGLMNLIEAWSNARPTGWRMVIAGNDENGHRAELEAAIIARGLNGTFEFLGAVEGESKWAHYRNADLFVLPSHSENFGIVIAEALGSGVPVITTRATPWRDIIEHRCGWWEEVGSKPLARALREAMSLSDEERRAMGQRGRALIESKYSWSHVAADMKSVYAWLLSQADRPDCVITA